MKNFLLHLLAAIVVMLASARGEEPQREWKFSFGSNPVSDALKVTPEVPDGGIHSYGFAVGALPTGNIGREGVVSDRPFTFFVHLPEGNYRVKAVLGGDAEATSTTIKVESRRLMVEKVDAGPGQRVTTEFTVNVRQPAIPGGGQVALKPGEAGPPMTPVWDDQLTIEFNGKRPAVTELEIKPDPAAVTLFLAGDSTVTDQRNEPWAGWGQILPVFFGPNVAVANHAESGLALFSFRGQKRLEKIVRTIKPGDYVFIQFGHNDQKDKSPNAGPFTTYKDNLKGYVEAVQSQKGIPVLVTSMERRRFSGTTPQPTLTEYAEAVRQVGAEMNVPVIDLNAMSLKFYQALGPEDTKKAFVYYAANTFPGQIQALKDDTHHNAYGAYELARCVVEGIKEKVPALAKFLKPDLTTFDPAHPDDWKVFSLPASPSANIEKPAGS